MPSSSLNNISKTRKKPHCGRVLEDNERSSLLRLPDEVFKTILLSLPLQDLLTSCARVCRNFYHKISAVGFLYSALKTEWKSDPGIDHLSSAQLQAVFWNRSRAKALSTLERFVKAQNDKFFRIFGGFADNRLKNIISRAKIRVKVRVQSKPISISMKMALRQLQINEWSVLAKFACPSGAFNRNSLEISAISDSVFRHKIISVTNENTAWFPVQTVSDLKGINAHYSTLQNNVLAMIFDHDNDFQFIILTIPSYSLFKLLIPFSFCLQSKAPMTKSNKEVQSVSIEIRGSNAVLWKFHFENIESDSQTLDEIRARWRNEEERYLTLDHIDWKFRYGHFIGHLKNLFMIDLTLWNTSGDIIDGCTRLVNPVSIAGESAAKLNFDSENYAATFHFQVVVEQRFQLHFVLAETNSKSYFIDELILKNEKIRRK